MSFVLQTVAGLLRGSSANDIGKDQSAAGACCCHSSGSKGRHTHHRRCHRHYMSGVHTDDGYRMCQKLLLQAAIATASSGATVDDVDGRPENVDTVDEESSVSRS